MTCPACGGTVTVTTNSVLSAPEPAAPWMGGWYQRGAVVDVRRPVVRTWAGCDACEWCGPVADARKGAA